MAKLLSRFSLLFVFIVLFFYALSSTQAYDNLNGVEYDDIIDISFVRYIDGRYSITYSDDDPFRVKVNYNELNHNVVDELLEMKKQETKNINWEVVLENGTIRYYEYRNTKIVRIVEDSTPGINVDIGRIFIIIAEVMAGIAGVGGAVYILYRVRNRLSMKKCINCSKQANSKCSKCGSFFCSECSVKGCSNCGSRQFIRL
ncbi:MAG: hypothetical protein HGN29_11515 [Asgard group archaeon]|nr:hypothetical protein [Asgard group archaeon]